VAALPGKPAPSPATSPAVSDSLDTWLIDRLFSSR